MSVFISHANVDKGLAEGLKDALMCITSETLPVWYSSETRPAGGVEPGDWRQQIWDRIEQAETILVVLTPQSNERPWLVWESGFAEGKKKKVVPILFWIKPDRMHSVFCDRQLYIGDDRQKVTDLFGRIIKIHSKNSPSDKARAGWGPAIDEFLAIVEKERQESDERRLFHDHFHNSDTSEKMTGRWMARWTGIDSEGNEKVFEADTLRAWTDERRIRMVGDGAKGKPYPMEGVVSSLGQVALTYWSEGDTAICGTVILRPSGAGIGSRFVGTWQGFTAPDLDSELKYYRGRVAMAKLPNESEDDGGAGAWIEKKLASPFDWIV